MKGLLKFILSAVAVIFAAELLPGVEIRGNFWDGLVVAAVIGILNAFLRPLLVLLTLPATLLTFGLFLFIINGLVIYTASGMMERFYVAHFGYALLFSFVFTLLGVILEAILGVDKKEGKK
jgi:putative membrane protein